MSDDEREQWIRERMVGPTDPTWTYYQQRVDVFGRPAALDSLASLNGETPPWVDDGEDV